MEVSDNREAMTGPSASETMQTMASDTIEIRAAVCRGFGAAINTANVQVGDARLRVDAPRLFRLYRSGRLKLDELVASRRPLAEINEAIENARRSQGLRHVIVFPG